MSDAPHHRSVVEMGTIELHQRFATADPDERAQIRNELAERKFPEKRLSILDELLTSSS